MKGKLIATFKVTSHFRTKISLFNRITHINYQEYEIDKVLDIIKTDSYCTLEREKSCGKESQDQGRKRESQDETSGCNMERNFQDEEQKRFDSLFFIHRSGFRLFSRRRWMSSENGYKDFHDFILCLLCHSER